MTDALRYRWVEAVRDDTSPLAPMSRLVAVELSFHMKLDGTNCRPGADRLARKTGLHRRTVERELRRLEAAGFLKVKHRSYGGRTLTNEYVPLIPETSAVRRPGTAERTSAEGTETSAHSRPDSAQETSVEDAKPRPTTDPDRLSAAKTSAHDRPIGIDREQDQPLASAASDAEDVEGDDPALFPDDGRRDRTAGAARRASIFEAVAHACSINIAELTASARARLNRVARELDEAGADPGAVADRAARYRARFPQVELTDSALMKHWASLGAASSSDPGRDPVASRRARIRDELLTLVAQWFPNDAERVTDATVARAPEDTLRALGDLAWRIGCEAGLEGDAVAYGNWHASHWDTT